MGKCVFCDIVADSAPSSIVYKDDSCTAFMDIKPVNPGHLLIVPNKHATYLADLNPETGAHIFKVAQTLSAALRKSGVKCEGVDLLLADGEAAGQEVFHLHLHVIPRYKGDGFGFKFGPNYEKPPGRPELDKVARAVKSKIP